MYGWMTYNLQKEAAQKQNNTRGVRRVLHNMRRTDNKNASMELSPEEIKEAEEEFVRLTQREAFRDEYTALSSGKPIPKKSQLIKLNPC